MVVVLRVGRKVKIVVGGDRDSRYAFREHPALIFETFTHQSTRKVELAMNGKVQVRIVRTFTKSRDNGLVPRRGGWQSRLSRGRQRHAWIC